MRAPFSYYFFRATIIVFSFALCGVLLAQGQDQSSAAASTCAISGRVLSQSTGGPLKGAQIRLATVSDKLQHDSDSIYQLFGAARLKSNTSSGENGSFCLAGVKPGRYFLSASLPGFLDSTYGGKTFLDAGSLLIVGDKPTTDLTLALTPLSGISGKVVDADGTPIVDANVSAIKRAWVRGRYIAMPVQGTQTNERGEYRIGGLTPGSYFVAVLPTLPGSAETSDPKPVRTLYPGVIDQDQATTVTVVAGQDSTGIDIGAVEARTAHVTGKVVGPPALLQEGAVNLFPRDEEPPMLFLSGGGTNLQSDGSFVFRDVNPGAYVLSFRSSNGAGDVPVDVRSTNVSVSVPVIADASLKGRIVVPGPQRTNLYAGKKVLLVGADAIVPPRYSGSVASNGEFAIASIVPGKYFISVSPPTPGFYIDSVLLSQSKAAGATVDLSAGGAADATINMRSGTATVSGTLEDSDEGATPTLSTIVLSPTVPRAPDGSDIQFTVADEKHNFTISGVAPGRYRAYAFQSLNSSVLQDPKLLNALRNFSIEFDVAENESKSIQLKSIPASGLQEAFSQANSQ